MSILDANGAMACAECGRQARAVRDRLKAENERLRNQLEDEKAENGWARKFLDRIGPKCGTKDCPDLVAYVGKLEDENARLRSCLSDDADNARQIMGENKRLRELCHDMWGWILAPTAGGEGLHEIADRVRELEIEVES